MNAHKNRDKRIVIVDDSRTIQAMLENIFEGCAGFKVVGVAGDADTAVKMISELRPDVVTIDLCMPYIDGAALLKMLADMPYICKIMISDHAANNAAMMAKLKTIGAAACIAKSEVSNSPTGFRLKLRSIVAAFEGSRGFVRSLPSHRGDIDIVRQINPVRPSMFGYPIPTDEQQRLDYVRRKQLANATPERQFDLLTRYVAQLTSFPICMMTFIDKDTQWMKSSFGVQNTSTPRSEAFCNYTIAQDDTFIVRNAANDPAFASNPFVTGDPQIKTYVGHPIITDDGVHAGALCIMDTKVRFVPIALVGRLKGMAEIVAEIINRRPQLAA